MNSYPQEFLAHPQPLMFVAGLTPSASTRERSTSSASTGPNRRPSAGSASLLEAAVAATSSTAHKGPASLTTPVASPVPGSEPVLAGSPDVGPGGAVSPPILEEPRGETPELDERDRKFEELVENLRGALAPLGGKGKVWLGERRRRDFRIVLVDKNVRLPMRKVTPSLASSTSPTADPSVTPHSPLSPLIPSSPLYPDGLIAPVWVRKHAELVPSVFILFLRLYESKPPGPGLETAEETQAREADEKVKEKEMDDLLVKEIGERRRRLGERGIKLTVVLMASSQTLDSPALDPRLSYLRRASALSAKASLFVLSPVPADQLPDFVQSLQEALYDSAMEYYSAHTKRVRRKRSRVPVSQLAMSPTAGVGGQGQGAQRSLGPQGWAVRYDWKLGWFAEARGEFEIARRHYEDCWNELAKMFSSTTTLPPRTKRWAEAKVLADCVAVRICKLHLYDNEGPRSLNSFFVHLKRFGDLSRGWGIGEETFEFWSWIARQYRIFAELLEMGQQSGLHIPSIFPPIFPTAAAASSVPPPPEYYSTPVSSNNPLQILQQPAFYYYTAATCSIQRQQRYQEALEVETDALSSEAGAASGYVSTAPGFANEKKVDHAALVIELFSKSYSLLKEQAYAQNRIALFVAFRIAETYCQAGQYDMAMRFFDRISQSFKRERWSPIVRQIRKLWYECAQRTGNVESAARLLVETMCPDSGVEEEERVALQDDLLSLFKTTAPAGAEPVVVEMDDSTGLLDVQAGFWQAEAVGAKSVPYQVALRCPENVEIADLKFTSLRVKFSDDRPDIVVFASTSESPAGSSDKVEVATPTESGATASLWWTPGKVLALNGEISSISDRDIFISGVTLGLTHGPWELEVRFIPGELTEWTTGKGGLVPVQGLASYVSFVPQPHELDVEIIHHPSAFVGDDLSIDVKVTNTDERELDVNLSVFLQPGDDGEEDGSTILIGDEVSTTLLKDIHFGPIYPGSTVTSTITLRVPLESTKIVDFSVLSTSKPKFPSGATGTTSSAPAVQLNEPQTEELNRTVVIPVLRPFDVQMGARYVHKGRKGGEAVVGIKVGVPSPRGLKVEGMELRGKEEDKEVRLVSSSLDGPSSFPQDWDHDTVYAVHANFDLEYGHRGAVGNPVQVPAELVFTWRSDASGPLVTTVHPLPPLVLPPPTDSFIIPTLHLPSPRRITPHQPFPLTLSILNTHPTHGATQMAIIVETAENFVWVGDRARHVPEVRAGEEVEVQLEVVGLSGAGWVTLPKISVWEGDGEDREEVRVRGGGMVFVGP
ncbi:hypothetical protein IAT38_000065 [Cryptococcus sp. DSM 104549]